MNPPLEKTYQKVNDSYMRSIALAGAFAFTIGFGGAALNDLYKNYNGNVQQYISQFYYK